MGCDHAVNPHTFLLPHPDPPARRLVDTIRRPGPDWSSPPPRRPSTGTASQGGSACPYSRRTPAPGGAIETFSTGGTSRAVLGHVERPRKAQVEWRERCAGSIVRTGGIPALPQAIWAHHSDVPAI